MPAAKRIHCVFLLLRQQYTRTFVFAYEEKNETRVESINEFAAFGFLTTLLRSVVSRRVFSGGVLLVRPQ